MEDTPRGQRTSVSKKSTGREDGGPPTGTTAHISSDNNSGAKTLIKYDIDESLEIKEEIIQDQQTMSESIGSVGSQDDGSYSRVTTHLSSGNNFGIKIKIEHDIDESLYIKEEIIEDPQRRPWTKHNLISRRNQLDEKCLTTEISFDNNSGVKTVIEYDIDESLDIKEEIIEDQQNIDQRLGIKSESKLCTINTRDADTMTVKKPRKSKKEKLHESKGEPEKKYKCEKCARSYTHKNNLHLHKKFVCGVKPQFSCEFCGKRFNRKCNMKTHALSMHQKKELKASEIRHNCEKCSRSYSSLMSLNRHKSREHAAVIPQFICDFCGFKTKRKEALSQHIPAHHLPKVYVSIPESEKIYKCEKCARSYAKRKSLYNHQKFVCEVVSRFSCVYCCKQFKHKTTLTRHVNSIHLKRNSKPRKTKYTCDKCSRSYSFATDLCRHRRLEHAAVKPQFICDYCGYKTKRKACLKRHINSKHLFIFELH